MSEPATVMSCRHTREGRVDRVAIVLSDGRRREFVLGIVRTLPPLMGMPEHEAMSYIECLGELFPLVEVVRE